MPRRPTGTLQWSGDPASPKPGDHWMARIRVRDREDPTRVLRPWIQLPPGLTEQEARRRAARYQARATERDLVPRPKSRGALTEDELETLRAWCVRWMASRAARGRKGARADQSRLATWVLPRLGDRPMSAVTRAEIEAWVEWIDGQVQADALGWKTALNAWGLLSKMFADASRGKSKALRVRTTNPTADVEPPERGVRRLAQYLYPNELLQVAECDAIGLALRRCYVLTIYLYLRSGELEALHWEDLDLVHGTAHVHRAMDADSGLIHETKGRAARRFQIEAEVLPLLCAMRAEAPADRRVFEVFPPWKDQAGQFRTSLRRAGVTRGDLFASDATRRNITFHDLRATGVTWAAVRGDEPLRIMHRAGHKDLTTTMGYVREAENVRETFGQVFPALPVLLLGSVHDRSSESDDPGRSGPIGTRTDGKSGRSARDRPSKGAELDFESLTPNYETSLGS